ncbi:NUDIX domain-containing protein [Zooshikella marina]|uniref:NUDIX domain-containing protein n=1 Tax=Zooshikella ganghwensis TaxID=202772 RepID=UPI001BB0A906|nr:NUDIX domain-containing protein [Zooshikella ganghwensis]MBU2706073.1 NUDIX domain-containing protein [Zooshikella ganghwensis]
MSEQSTFDQSSVEVVKKERVFSGFFKVDRFQLRHQLFAGGWSPVLQRELFIRPEAVGVLLLDLQHDSVVLVEQFRVGALVADTKPWLLEIVAGLVAPGESLEDVACREAKEEANCDVQQLMPICEYLSSPGGSSEKLTLFCGLVDSSNLGGIHGLEEEGEDIRVQVVKIDEAFALLGKGVINNAAAIIALQWLQINLPNLRQQALKT